MLKRIPDDPIAFTALATALAVVVSLVAIAVAAAWSGPPGLSIAYVLAIGLPAVIAPLAVHPLVRAKARLRRAQNELERVARTDALTSLPNRRAFFEHAAAMLTRPQKAASPLTAMMIDVDHFRSINDLDGQAGGDAMLRELAARIRDVVAAAEASDWIVARLGGEEFAVLAEGLVPSAVGRLAERICQVARRLGGSRTGGAGVGGGGKRATTLSLGVAFHAEGMDVDALVKIADDALDVARRAGRDRWAFAIQERERGDRPPPSRRMVEFIRPATR